MLINITINVTFKLYSLNFYIIHVHTSTMNEYIADTFEKRFQTKIDVKITFYFVLGNLNY